MTKPSGGLSSKLNEVLMEKIKKIIWDHVGIEGYDDDLYVDGQEEAAKAIVDLVAGCVPPERESGVSWGRQDPETHGWNDCRKVLLDNMGVGE